MRGEEMPGDYARGDAETLVHIGFISIESPFETTRGGGISAYLRAIVLGLIKAGQRVTLITNARGNGVWYRHGSALRVVQIRLPNIHWYLSKIPGPGKALVLSSRQLEWSLKFYRVAMDVFQKDPVEVLESAQIGALLLARCRLAPVVVRLHGSDYIFRKHLRASLPLGARLNHGLERAVLRHAHAITSPSFSHATEIAREMDCVENRFYVIPNPIGPEMLTKAMAAREAAERNQSTPTILYTGRLAPVKGIEPLLEAARETQKLFRPVRFVLAGPWQMPEKPERWGLEKNEIDKERGVVWVGHIPWMELPQQYCRADVFVMPSYYETFGISCLEAMAFGLPVVATKAGGLPEVVNDGVTGILIPPGDPHALTEAIIGLLRDPERRRRMGEAGRERVLTEFTLEEVVQSTLSVYRHVISSFKEKGDG